MTIKKPRHLYFTDRKEFYRRQKISISLKEYHLTRKFALEPIKEEQEKQEYRRQSYVLTAYYDSEMFFDWRVSILNSQKSNTEDYLKKVLTNRWEKWAVGKRSEGWSFIIEAFEDEFIDKSEASKFLKENVVVWEKR